MYGTVGNHKPEWLFEEFCDIDIDKLRLEMETLHDHMPWFDFTEADDSDLEVGHAWREATTLRSEEKYKGATRGARARLRDMNWKYRKGSYHQELKEQYNTIGGVYTKVEPRSCYAWHTDKCIGFQIPVISNPDCFFMFKLDDNKSYHFHPEPGKAYLINNRVTHTFMNGGDLPRYYLLQIVNPKNLTDPEYLPYVQSSGWELEDYMLSREYT